MSNQMRFPNNPANRTEILLNENITQLTKVADCVDTGTNLLKVDIENATIEAENLATKENQQTIIDATLRDINNTGGIGDGQSNATAICMGYDRTNGQGRSILVDSAGRQDVNILGNTEGDGSGTAHNIHVDGSGNLLTSIVSSVNILPANSVNSGITDDPANSIAVGLRARTDIADAATETFILTDSAGHLQCDILSGGGGDASAANQSTMITKLGEIDTAQDLTNSKLDGIDTVLDNILTKNTEIDTAIDSMSAKLPASLGQKANASSLSICRSSTTGAFDMSARTTIGTASTSTKLLCDSAGRLAVNNGLQSSHLAVHEASTTNTSIIIADTSSKTTKAISMSDIRAAILEPSAIGYHITSTGTGGSGSDIQMEVSLDGTNYITLDTNISASSKSTFTGNLNDDDIGLDLVGAKFRFKITNNSGGSAAYTIDIFAYGMTFAQA